MTTGNNGRSTFVRPQPETAASPFWLAFFWSPFTPGYAAGKCNLAHGVETLRIGSPPGSRVASRRIPAGRASKSCWRRGRSAGLFAARPRSLQLFAADSCRSKRPAAAIRSLSRNSAPGNIRLIATALPGCAPPASSNIASRPRGRRPVPGPARKDGLMARAAKIDKNLAKRAQALDQMSDAEFEDHAAEAKRSNHVFRRIGHHVGSLTWLAPRAGGSIWLAVLSRPDRPETFRPH
jgi:hypothetical protein